MSIFDFLHKKNPSIGLALSGGSTHGAAHIGALMVLEREGYGRILWPEPARVLWSFSILRWHSLDELCQMFMK